ncbi:hypothetical protein ACFO25_09725 [Paenactinomyces guangxiensis]|uniref:Uncharacterized protein n=1 Tax=Paenactinomyces guangxiensis TaxID=1490290 RepID=A0A7W2A9B6_9BACL|nr:hypothetical protein [Paenactinomyces guangxiensis]MBA4495064.1 hypothetical protein [Paenactinomyces guangxiensis]MBH8592252.1 hypothetical protein [Paenactinomyces guangxiensis]
MRRILNLTLADLKNVRRDPMLIMAIAGPAMLTLVFRFVPPILTEWLTQKFGFDLTAYYDLILIFILQLVPLMIGMVSGYLMLDERDENLIQLFAVTPLRKSGYLFVRLAMPVLLTIMFTILLVYFTGLIQIKVVQLLPTILLLAMEAPMMALFLVSFAANKVEGLALSKGIGIIVAAPFAAYFIQWPWQIIAGISPTYWVAKMFFADSHSYENTFFLTVSLLMHGALMWYLFLTFQRRLD